MDTPGIAVSGANGFVGLHLLRRLAGNAGKITAMHHRPLADDLSRKYRESVTWCQVDIVTDDLSMALRNVQVVYHLAAYASSSEAPAEVSKMERVNCLGTARLAAASKRAGVRHFIFVSSVAACEAGDTADIDESNGVPRSSYGRTKRTAEDSVLALSSPDFAVTVIRPTALFGEDHRGSVYELVRVIDKGRFFILGDGSNRTNFYYVEDFVAVLIAVAGNPRAFGQVFIACDAPYSLRQLVDGIGSALGAVRRPAHVPRILGIAIGTLCDIASVVLHRSMPLSRRRVRAMTRDVAYHNEKLEKVLGLRPEVGLFEGLRISIDWYRLAGLL
jgi:nucleoside-diphosphate-sugar epimerase